MMNQLAGGSGRRRVVTLVVSIAALAASLVSCSSTDRSAEAFCVQLSEATGPNGAEIVLIPGDSGRLDAIVAELQALLERAPDEIATTVSTLVEFFESYQRAGRDDRRQLLIDREAELTQASARLDAYALEECGLFLQRAVPTPVTTTDPGIEVAPE